MIFKARGSIWSNKHRSGHTMPDWREKGDTVQYIYRHFQITVRALDLGKARDDAFDGPYGGTEHMRAPKAIPQSAQMPDVLRHPAASERAVRALSARNPFETAADRGVDL